MWHLHSSCTASADPRTPSPFSIRRAVWLCVLAGSSKPKHCRVAYKQNKAAAAGSGPVARQSNSCAAGLCLRDSRIIELLSSFHCPKSEAQPQRCVWVLSCGNTSNGAASSNCAISSPRRIRSARIHRTLYLRARRGAARYGSVARQSKCAGRRVRLRITTVTAIAARV